MATFSRRQRVKAVGADPGLEHNIGLVGTFLRYGSSPHTDRSDCFVQWDSLGHETCEISSWLAPLTDPAADAFLANLKKLAREPNNIVEKEEIK